MNKNAQIILDTINASTDHPTAEQVYLHLKFFLLSDYY